jgi:hypothetical protein
VRLKLENNKSVFGNQVKAQTASVSVAKPAPAQPATDTGPDVDKGWKVIDARVSGNRNLCIFIYETRQAMESKPKDDAEYVKAFRTAIDDKHPLAKELKEELDKAKKLWASDTDYEHKITQKRVPKESWKGKFDIKTECFVPRKPESHAPTWWRKLEIDVNHEKWSASDTADLVEGDVYCSAYEKSDNLQELIQNLWYVGKDGEAVRKVIKKCHKELNDWCERNNKESVSMLKDRKSYLSDLQAKKYIKSKTNPFGFIKDKPKSS